jgi:hypothetical protein
MLLGTPTRHAAVSKKIKRFWTKTPKDDDN